ncbi:MAG: stage II sporulation protein E [Bacillota bacterium]
MLERADTYPYRRQTRAKGRGLQAIRREDGVKGLSSKDRHRKNTSFYRALKDQSRGAALYIAGFFLGRAVLLGQLTPFGPAFAVAATLTYGGRVWPVWAGVLLGQVLLLKGVAAVSAAAATLTALFLIRISPRDFLEKPLGAPGLVAVTIVVTKTGFLAFQNPNSYEYVSIFFEAAFAGVLVYVFSRGLAAWRQKRGLQLTVEEIFCLLAMVAGVIAGTGELAVGLVSLKGVLTRLCLLLAAATAGGGAGAAAGAILGVIPGLAYTVAPQAVSNYAFAGFLGGCFRGFGKAGVVVGFALGNVLLALYIKDLHNLSRIVAETGVATLAYLVIPVRWYAGFRSSISGVTGTATEKKVYEELVLGRLSGWAQVLDELAATFHAAGAVKQTGENRTVELLKEVKDRVCGNCPLNRTCWQWEEKQTVAILQEAVSLLEGKGRLQPGDLPEYLEKRCVKLKELTLTVGLLYETFRLNRYWYRRIVESRAVVAEQLHGIAQVLKDFYEELGDGFSRVAAIEAELWEMVRNGKLKIDHLQVSLREDGRIEVKVSTCACAGNLYCQRVVAPVISGITRQTYSVAHTACPLREGEEKCWFTLYPALRYRLAVGMATAGKEGGMSGDSYSCIQVPGGRYVLVLSDGMGSGADAAAESTTAVSLLELLLRAGFGEELAVKTVNSLLLLHSPGESYATVDLAVIDLYNGRLQWVKIGAAPGFIYRRDGTVEIVRAPSLPVGIVNPIEVVVVEKEMRTGDVLLLVTDGLFDFKHNEGREEEWFLDCLQEAVDGDPRKMGSFILNRARLVSGGVLPDDATVVVARVMEAERG